MKLLIDTHLLLWATLDDPKIPRNVRPILRDPANDLYVSAASIWEVAIKSSRGDQGFRVHPQALLGNLLENGYLELAINGEHTLAVYSLPPIHKDPFDRILIAQATVEAITLLTSDRQVAKYPGPIRKV